MATDWELIRELMAATIDACEATERLGVRETDRPLLTGTGANVFDVMTSAWTYPENVRYAVVRARHELSDDAPYRPELARVLTEVGAVCAELVGAQRLDEASANRTKSVRQTVQALVRWYRDQMPVQLALAVGTRGE
jgi:hypothetical protein